MPARGEPAPEAEGLRGEPDRAPARCCCVSRTIKGSTRHPRAWGGDQLAPSTPGGRGQLPSRAGNQLSGTPQEGRYLPPSPSPAAWAALAVL